MLLHKVWPGKLDCGESSFQDERIYGKLGMFHHILFIFIVFEF